MRDKRIISAQFKILHDRQLSDGAKVLGVLICSHVYTAKHIWCEDPFPLPWTLASKLCHGICKAETYHRLCELSKRHLKHEGVKGCPGQAHFRLIL